jgi:2-polyprenyl-3-methyl-5-hydroxy-6-metoxy-1,4-benzoquinol methylase
MLKAIAGRKPAGETAFAGKSKLLTQLGQQFMRSVVGPVVIDYGCCEGHECIELAKMGLSRVIGIDIRENVLNKARINAAAAGVSDVCEFTTNTAEMARTIN